MVKRGGTLTVDNGLCHHTREVVYFSGWGPKRMADCKVNEVAVPTVVGRPLPAARELLSARPLTPFVVDVPSKPGAAAGARRLAGPEAGFLSSDDRVVLFVTKAQHGVVPDLVGISTEEAERLLKALSLEPTISFGDGPAGTVVAQQPRPGVAAAPGLKVALVVARG